MSDLRHDFLDDRWVLCVPERGQRPHDRRHGVAREPAPAHDPDCPFCPGNEAALLGILAERPGVAGTAWATRVVPNRFPILRPASGAPAPGAAVHGVHEVVIETPRHDRQLADLSPDELVAVAHTYHARARVHAGHAPWQLVFRNHGAGAGTSLAHAHAHVIAADTVPPAAALREDRARRHFAGYGRCYLCEVIARERADGVRLVAENERFVAFVPYAAEAQYEVWLAPRRHAAHFAAASAADLAGFADLLGRLLRRVRERLADPDYNFMVLSASSREPAQAAWHWFLRLRPRLATRGGFELASGYAVNPSTPERDAGALRA